MMVDCRMTSCRAIVASYQLPEPVPHPPIIEVLSDLTFLNIKMTTDQSNKKNECDKRSTRTCLCAHNMRDHCP